MFIEQRLLRFSIDNTHEHGQASESQEFSTESKELNVQSIQEQTHTQLDLARTNFEQQRAGVTDVHPNAFNEQLAFVAAEEQAALIQQHLATETDPGMRQALERQIRFSSLLDQIDATPNEEVKRVLILEAIDTFTNFRQHQDNLDLTMSHGGLQIQMQEVVTAMNAAKQELERPDSDAMPSTVWLELTAYLERMAQK